MPSETTAKRITRREFLKSATVGIGAVAALSAISACQPTAPEAGQQSAGAPSTSKPGEFDWKKFKGKKITLALNKHPYTDSLMPLLDQFKNETGMDAEFLILPEAEYTRKIELDLSTGAGEYDVFMTGPTRNWTYAAPGWIEPLDKYIKSDLTHPEYAFDDFFPLLVDANRWDKTIGGGVGKGDLWAIPVMVETYCVAHRTDIFEERGVKVPSTMDEWEEAAKKCTYKDKNGNQIYGIIARGVRESSSLATGFISSYKAYGNTDFDAKMNCVINTPESAKFFDQYARIVRQASTPGWTSVTWYEGKESFTEGKYAMYYDCDFFAAGYEDPKTSKIAGKVAYGPPLAPSPDKRYTRIWAWSLGMSSRSKNKEAAWYLIQWATSKKRLLDATVKYNNYNPTRKSVFDAPEVQALMGKWGGGTYLPVVLDNINKFANVAYTPNPELPMFGTRWAQALHEIWGGKPAQAALDEAVKEINENMKKAGLLKT